MYPHVWNDISALNQPNWMILGARESRRNFLSAGTKILKIDSPEIFWDDFEKNIFENKILELYCDICIGNPIESQLIILGISMKY